jgi:hypothetical protein
MQPATDYHVIARRGYSPDVAISSEIEVKCDVFSVKRKKMNNIS